MMTEDKLMKIEQMSSEELKKNTVFKEKGDKGLYERAEGDITVLTEDNKMLLVD